MAANICPEGTSRPPEPPPPLGVSAGSFLLAAPSGPALFRGARRKEVQSGADAEIPAVRGEQPQGNITQREMVDTAARRLYRALRADLAHQIREHSDDDRAVAREGLEMLLEETDIRTAMTAGFSAPKLDWGFHPVTRTSWSAANTGCVATSSATEHAQT